MPIDLSYLATLKGKPTEDEEKLFNDAVHKECLRAIQLYLVQIAEQMDANKIETLNVPTIRAMADEMEIRVQSYEGGKPNLKVG